MRRCHNAHRPLRRPRRRAVSGRALLPTLATIAAVALFVVGRATGSSGRMQREGSAARAVRRGGRAWRRSRLPRGRDRLGGVALSAGRRRRARSTRARQILIDNKVHDGRAGYHVVTPLVLADGRAVLVDRGWVAAGRDARASCRRSPPPAGTVTVRGRVNVPAARLSRAVDATRRRAPSGRTSTRALRGGDRRRRAADRRRADGADRRRRRPGARLAGARLRHRQAPDLHGAVVLVRGAGGRAVARASTCAATRDE